MIVQRFTCGVINTHLYAQLRKTWEIQAMARPSSGKPSGIYFIIFILSIYLSFLHSMSLSVYVQTWQRSGRFSPNPTTLPLSQEQEWVLRVEFQHSEEQEGTGENGKHRCASTGIGLGQTTSTSIDLNQVQLTFYSGLCRVSNVGRSSILWFLICHQLFTINSFSGFLKVFQCFYL